MDKNRKHQTVSYHYLDNRAVFHWVSKVISRLLWFCITTLCDWLKILLCMHAQKNFGHSEKWTAGKKKF